MHIDFILDTGCIWSYIAFRRLQKALSECQDIPVEITPFFMSSAVSSFFPGLTLDPATRTHLLKEKIEPSLKETGISVDFESLPRLPNDLSPSYRLVRSAFEEGKGMAVLEDVFYTFFTHSKNICRKNILTEIAVKHSLPKDFLQRKYALSAFPLVKKEGLRAVPCFIFNHKAVIFGAHSTECLKNMLFLSQRLESEKTFIQI